MNYLQILEDSYKMSDDYDTRLQWLASEVFGFTTYESEVATLLACKALDVCEAINEATTFDYIANQDDHMWYLIMVNMPFFTDKISWGTSIRGTWWQTPYGKDSYSLEYCDTFLEGHEIRDWTIPQEEWETLIKSILEFSRDEREG